MSGEALSFVRSSGLAGAPFRLALAISAALHLGTGLVLDSVRWREPVASRAPVTARLVRAASDRPLSTTVAADEPARESPTVGDPAPLPEVAGRSASAAARPGNQPPSASVPLPVDPRYYPAEEIDVFPKPLAPLIVLERDGEAGETNARIRISLHIDERGGVNRLRVVEADPAGAAEADLARMAGTRFSPALRNGRPVRSQVVLEIRRGAIQEGFAGQ